MRLTPKLYLILILLIAFWLRLDNLDTLPPGVSRDESFNAADIFILARTGILPLYEDPTRPEYLNRLILSVATLFGSSVWAFRLVQVLGGVITVALADWAARQCLPDLPRPIQRIAGLAAAGSLAVALNHVVLSRALYRGLWQPVWMLLFTGFLMRGLSKQPGNGAKTNLYAEYRDFIFAGLALGLALHTYTAALVLPLALPAVALSLLIFRFRQWRRWLPGLILLGVTLAIITAPIMVMLIRDRDRVLTRAGDVGSGLTRDNARERLERAWDQITERGDINSQYNADYAPVLPPLFDRLFLLGLVALVLRLRHPSSVLLASLLLLATLPVIMAGEIPHGLRIAGELAVFPVIVGVGVGAVMGAGIWAWNSVRAYRDTPLQKRAAGFLHTALALAVIALTIHTARDAHARYRAWWDNNDHPWEVYGRELRHGDWFFRTDHRDLGAWLTDQTDPLLVPVSAITEPTMRAWLQARYTHTTAAATLPPVDTLRLVIPWALELGDLRWDTRQFALLHGDTIIILPPLDPGSYAAVRAARDPVESVYRANGDLLLEYRPIAPEMITFEPRTRSTDSEPLAVFDDAVAVVGWRGPDTLDGSPETLTYTLDLSPTQNGIPHYYSAFVHLHTPAYQRLTGSEQPIFRWLYPPPLWKRGDVITIPFTLDTPELSPGAYRLILGLYRGDFPHLRVPVTRAAGPAPDGLVTLGWIKVPQRTTPTPDAVSYDAVLGDQQFALIGSSAAQTGPDTIQLTLTWRALVDRPALDATIFVHALDRAGGFITQDDTRPTYPTFIWDAGEIVQTEHTLVIGVVSPEDIHLIAGMYLFVDATTPQRLDVMQDGAAVPDQIVTLGDLADLLP